MIYGITSVLLRIAKKKHIPYVFFVSVIQSSVSEREATVGDFNDMQVVIRRELVCLVIRSVAM